MGWPKGLKRGPRQKNKPMLTLEQAMAASGMIVEVNQDLKTVDATEIETPEEEKICPIEELPEWGLGFDSRMVIVYKRKQYQEDVTLQKKVNGESVNVNYKAGDWGEWNQANGTSKGPYYNNLKSALLYVHDQNIKTSIKNAGIVKNLAQIIKDSEDKIMKVVKA